MQMNKYTYTPLSSWQIESQHGMDVCLELITKAFLACQSVVVKKHFCLLVILILNLCVSTYDSVLNPGPECADHQPYQRISSAGGGCRAAPLRSAPGHSGGKVTQLCHNTAQIELSWYKNKNPRFFFHTLTFLSFLVLLQYYNGC